MSNRLGPAEEIISEPEDGVLETTQIKIKRKWF